MTQAIADLATSDGTLKSSIDIFSSAGNIAQWKALAYSAKARYYMQAARGTNYAAADLNNVITNALLGDIAVDGSQDVSFVHSTSQGQNENLWYSFLVNDRTGYLSAATTFAEPMLYYRNVDGKSNDTMRLQYYYEKTTGYTDLNYYDAGAGFDIAQSFPICRASETLLLLAEASYYQGSAANALTYLNSARTYANNVYGSNLSAYVAGDLTGADALTGNSKLLQAILNEQYLATAFQIESFNLARRVNYAFTYTDSSNVEHVMAHRA